MAGFQVILHGRIWVITEGWTLGSLINFDDLSTPFALSREKTNPIRRLIVLLL